MTPDDISDNKKSAALPTSFCVTFLFSGEFNSFHFIIYLKSPIPDAAFGNVAYDLASLIDDVRLKTSTRFKQDIFEEYIKTNKKTNIENFKNDFEILSVLRNLKIIGIFTRLSIRDKKDNYLKLIPYAWKLIEQRIDQDKKFIELKIILDRYFSKKVRNKYEN